MVIPIVASVALGAIGGWFGRGAALKASDSYPLSPDAQSKRVEDARTRVRQDFEVANAESLEAMNHIKPITDALDTINKGPGTSDEKIKLMNEAIARITEEQGRQASSK